MNTITLSLSISLCLLPLAWTPPAAAEDRIHGDHTGGDARWIRTLHSSHASAESK